MPQRRKPQVRMREYDRQDQITVVDFLIDRFQVIDHALARCREMLALERNEFTVSQVAFYDVAQSNMLWLLSTLPVYRKTSASKLAQVKIQRGMIGGKGTKKPVET